jgi:uncharacterized protein
VSGRPTSGPNATERLLVWRGLDAWRAECAYVRVEEGRLSAHGTQLGIDPEPYRLDYRLTTGPELITEALELSLLRGSRLRRLLLERASDGSWKADNRPVEEVRGALDCDLALSPLTNYMPAARLAEGVTDHVMAWVSVPDLEVTRSEQRYERLGENRVRFVGLEDGFTAELELDEDGFVIRYPDLAERA